MGERVWRRIVPLKSLRFWERAVRRRCGDGYDGRQCRAGFDAGIDANILRRVLVLENLGIIDLWR